MSAAPVKGVPVLAVAVPRHACAVCKFGPADGVSIFQTPGDTAWACARHLRFVSSRPVAPLAQRILDSLADGSLR